MGTQWHCLVTHRHTLHMLTGNVSQQTQAYINLIRTLFCLGSGTGVTTGWIRRGPCLIGKGVCARWRDSGEKSWGYVVLWRGVSTCVKPQTDREGHSYAWKHNNRMNKGFFFTLNVCVSESADHGGWTHRI